MSSLIGEARPPEGSTTGGHGVCGALAAVNTRIANLRTANARIGDPRIANSRTPFARSRAWRVAVVATALVAACATPAQRGSDSALAEKAAGDDTARIARLEREARALANTSGCDAASSCRTAPVGVRGCGGPRDYLVYCAATTDSTALMRKLDELARVEAAYNEREGVVSTCQLRLPPPVTVSGGRCVATR
jgi:hypothetical protein